MRILHVTHSDILGGAARAAYRLHSGLRDFGVDSLMLTNFKHSTDNSVIGPVSPLSKLKAQIAYSLEYKHLFLKPNSLFSSSIHSFSGNVKKINELCPDVVHLHWVNGGMLSVKEISKIAAPVVWSMHDNWLFTGGCHIMHDCKNYLDRCGNCNVLNSSSSRDLSSKGFNHKLELFANKKDIFPIGLSQWLQNAAQQSPILSGCDILNLPNPINTRAYQPFPKSSSRELWQLPVDKKLVLFGAMSATSDPNKGHKYLVEALHKLGRGGDVELVVFGSGKPENDDNSIFQTHYVGTLSDDVALRTLYSACDVMVVPSKQENLSNAIMESLACGTPVVGFDIGGNSDLIDHKQNGYLAKPYEADDLACGIEWVLNSADSSLLSNNAVMKVHQCFAEEVVIPRYLDLYNNILNKVDK